MHIVVTGSIAFDYLMSFPGKFTEHLMPEHVQRVSLSFLVDTMDKRRGGCGPNIAYTLALLGERPRLMATAGQDFPEYRQWLEAAGVDTSLVLDVPGKFTASFFCSTDADNNQIASFYTGAMANASELSFRGIGPCDMAIVSPNDPGAMLQYVQECRTLGIPFIFDPGQQCARMSGLELEDGIRGAMMVICNDYELELIRQKTGLGEPEILQQAGMLVVTRGEHGCTILTSARALRRARGRSAPDRGSHRRGRRVPGRLHEGHGARGEPRNVRAPGQRGSHLRARTPRRQQPRVHVGGVHPAGTRRTSESSRRRSRRLT